MKRILKVIIIFLILMIINISNVFATENLKIDIIVSDKNAKVDDIIDVTIDWSEGMQAADYVIHYEPDKLEFVSANIPDSFYNINTSGELIVVWVSLDGESLLSKMVFKFKVIDSGESSISISVDAFANEKLESPSNFVTQPVVGNFLPKFADGDDVLTTPTPTPIPTSSPIPTEKPSNQPTEKPSNTPNNSDKKDNVVQIEQQEDKSLTNNKIPYAGTSGRVIIFITLILIISVILLIKLKNLRDVE